MWSTRISVMGRKRASARLSRMGKGDTNKKSTQLRNTILTVIKNILRNLWKRKKLGKKEGTRTDKSCPPNQD